MLACGPAYAKTELREALSRWTSKQAPTGAREGARAGLPSTETDGQNVLAATHRTRILASPCTYVNGSRLSCALGTLGVDAIIGGEVAATALCGTPRESVRQASAMAAAVAGTS